MSQGASFFVFEIALSLNENFYFACPKITCHLPLQVPKNRLPCVHTYSQKQYLKREEKISNKHSLLEFFESKKNVNLFKQTTLINLRFNNEMTNKERS